MLVPDLFTASLLAIRLIIPLDLTNLSSGSHRAEVVATVDTENMKELTELPSAQRDAYFGYDFAVQQNGRPMTDGEAYKWLILYPPSDLNVPKKLETWCRNLGRARKRLGTQKRQRRIALTTRSIVRGEPQSGRASGQRSIPAAQKLRELVSDLHLSEGEQHETKWQEAARLLEQLGLGPDQIQAFREADDPVSLVKWLDAQERESDNKGQR
jgi:hypothetical protein